MVILPPFELLGEHVGPFLNRPSLNALRLTNEALFLEETLSSTLHQAPPWPETHFPQQQNVAKKSIGSVAGESVMPEWPVSLQFSTIPSETSPRRRSAPTVPTRKSNKHNNNNNDGDGRKLNGPIRQPPPTLACIDERGLIHVWRATDGQHCILDDGAPSRSIAFLPNSTKKSKPTESSSTTRLVSGCVDGSIRIWESSMRWMEVPPPPPYVRQQQEQPHDLPKQQQQPPHHDTTTSKSGCCCASFIMSKLWIGHGTSICAVGVSSDGGILASGGIDGTVRLWNLQSVVSSTSIPRSGSSAPTEGPRTHLAPPGIQLLPHGDSTPVSTLIFSPIRRNTGIVVTSTESSNSHPHDHGVDGIRLLASVYDVEACIRIWKIITPPVPTFQQQSSSSSSSCVTSPSTCGYSLWRTLKHSGAGGGVSYHLSVAWSPCATYLVSAGVCEPVQLWNAARGASLGLLPSSSCLHPGTEIVSHVAISPYRNHVMNNLTGSSPREGQQHKSHHRQNSMVIAFGFLGGHVSLWNVRVSECHNMRKNKNRSKPCDCGSRSPSSRRSSSSSRNTANGDCGTDDDVDSNDQSIRSPMVATSTLLRELPPRNIPFPILSLAFASDGRTLAGSSRDGIRLWNTTTAPKCNNTKQ
jgi:WD40 repeat protein